MDIRTKIYLLVLTLLYSQTVIAIPLWSELPAQANNKYIHTRQLQVDHVQLQSVLSSADLPTAGQAAKTNGSAQIELPMPDGRQQVFNIVESPIMAAELSAQFPQIKTYRAIATNDASINGRLDIGPNGFHGYLFTPGGEVFIDPVVVSGQQEYYSYYKHDYVSNAKKEFSCGVQGKSSNATSGATSPLAEFKTAEFVAAARTGLNEFISYRIAVAATGEYTQRVAGGNAITAFNEIATAINRISGIYERDLAIKLVLVSGTNVIYTNPLNDPYTDPTDPSQTLTDNQSNLDGVIGSDNYDIGHVFSIDPGGLASLGVACYPGYKAQGVSGLSNPTGDPFYIDIVAHEIGHQLGADHSFNGTTGSCAGNRNPATAYEPGSGATIMGYAGLCNNPITGGDENIAVGTDAMFHAGSIAEIIKYTRYGDGKICSGPVASQEAPVANAGQDYIIPGGTPFVLIGSADDTDTPLNNLTYQWDQVDVGSATSASTHGTDIGSNALFRSYLPTVAGERTLPAMATLLGTNADPYAAKAETLPTENRILNFRLTVRDNNGGVDEDDMQVVVNGNAGPFEIIQPNTNVNLNPGLPQLIEWNTACTNQAPINCSNVDILLSIDGGQTYTSLVGGSTANDGSQYINLPNGNTNTARIKIACIGNIFFDISDIDFEINSATGGSLTASGIAPSCSTATIPTSTGDDIEPNDYEAQAQALIFPAELKGTVNDQIDPYDFFVFVAESAAYSFTLSNYVNNDLDLIL
ncbi:MAG: M12 family metallo-peptidase, partial [Gammaproteobacteria bacterium]|nr:M12 family metallo-peptidase [Gammaproteobacteria bacterium]